MSCFVLENKSINEIARGIYQMSMLNNITINGGTIYCDDVCKDIIHEVNKYTKKKYWKDNFEKEIASVLKYINEKTYYIRYSHHPEVKEPKFEKMKYET